MNNAGRGFNGKFQGNRGSWRSRGNWRWRARGSHRGRGRNANSGVLLPPPSPTPSSSSRVFSGTNSSSSLSHFQPPNERNPGPNTGLSTGSTPGSIMSEALPRLNSRQNASLQDCPVKGWALYFLNEDYSTGSKRVENFLQFKTYLTENRSLFPSRLDLEEKKSFVVDYELLVDNEKLKLTWPTLIEDLHRSPSEIISCLGLAMHEILLQERLSEVEKSGSLCRVTLPRINARLVDHSPYLPLKDLKSTLYGRLVTVRGTVVRTSYVKPLCTRLAFQCTVCAFTQVVSLPQGKYTTPSFCANPDPCRSTTFAPLRESPFTETVDWQTARVQEYATDEHLEIGRIPRTIDCELTEDLVNNCLPGDIVLLTGIVRVLAAEDTGKRTKDQGLFSLYIEAVGIENLQKRVSSTNDQAGVVFADSFTQKDYSLIRTIHDEPQLFRFLVRSLCPAIYGQELVKAGLLLGLLGGTVREVSSDRLAVRPDIHVLIVGDPGLGKSQMLQATASAAPRGVYVCGNTTTKSGLTVTVTKEGGGDYGLEAGALVLADQGVCCIDEFDKMSSQHQALLEAMEQQSISLAKAGLVCSLPARTSILAAANPVGGHYNRAKTVAENLRLNSALLSRFDLVFLLLDKPDTELDSLLSAHVMAMAAGAGSAKIKHCVSPKPPRISSDSFVVDNSLKTRLAYHPGEEFDPLPTPLLRKYIAYARQYVKPRLTDQARQVLQDFYLQLRKTHQNSDSTPVTTRQLESLIRLSEARAKAELREEVTGDDAKDVIELMKQSLYDVFADVNGLPDFSRSQNGSGMSGRGQAKNFISALQRLSEAEGKNVFTIQEMRNVWSQCGFTSDRFGCLIDSLNTQGYLLKKGASIYQLQTA